MENRKILNLDNLKEIIGEKKSFKSLNINLSDDEKVSIQKENPEYIQPYLSNPDIGLGIQISQSPKVILISAPGASGKSQLCSFLSSSIGIPVVNLSKCRQVGTHSLTGMLTDAFGPYGYAIFSGALHNGEQSLIIDAIDEGILKSGMTGFEAFLDDVLKYISPNYVSVIMLGRPQSIENVALYLDSKKIPFSTLQIASFSREQAECFIDKKVAPLKKFEKPYKELRDYILQSIGSFFLQQKEAEESFLGYAPVLDAITTAIKQGNDYNAMLSDLKAKASSGLDIVIDIVKYILNREKELKVNRQGIAPLESRLSKEHYQRAITNVYVSIEQCKAVLKRVYNEKYEISISDDPSVNAEFNLNLNGFITDHPFLINRSFQNIVFESYVLASLMYEDPDNLYLEYYLSEYYKDNYMLFFIYSNLYGNSDIQPQFISTLYRSIISFDSASDTAYTDIIRTDDLGTHTLLFRRNLDGLQYQTEFTAIVPDNFKLDLGPVVSNILVDSEQLVLNTVRKSTEFVSPVTILCKELNVGGEIFISKQPGGKENKDNFVNKVDICTERIRIDYNQFGTPTIQINSPEVLLNIDCQTGIQRPFAEYQTKIESLKTNLTEEEDKVFVKLRKILITFRSHSKGTMARYKNKIEDSRISGNKYGEKIIEMLLEKNVIQEANNNFYELNRENTANVLGLTFDQLKNATLNPKMKSFISLILNS